LVESCRKGQQGQYQHPAHARQDEHIPGVEDDEGGPRWRLEQTNTTSECPVETVSVGHQAQQQQPAQPSHTHQGGNEASPGQTVNSCVAIKSEAGSSETESHDTVPEDLQEVIMSEQAGLADQ